ncbi:apolipoprotein N-acyltransferase [Aestuariibacter salexigens]|uniref:apolipoprotein N-acyltransferase n=1 Tax=Aestuariibacter salexigens TaxID=226010 RepID=UPI00042062B1|nr:apolipoprotein N-acyltransferase [Aestuariibacter salexigens]
MLRYIVALLAGASLTLAYAPFGLWPIVFIAVPLVIILLQRIEPRRQFLFSWLFGLGWFGAGISWVHVSIADFGGLPLIASMALMFLLCGYLALFPAAALNLIANRFPTSMWPLALPVAWTLFEWLRSWLLTGFPWLSIGYSQIDSPLSGWMPVIGETGVSALVMMLCAGIAVWLPQRKWLAVLTVSFTAFFSGFVLNTVSWTEPGGEQVNVAMVQGNIRQELRWAPEQDMPTMQKYLDLTQSLWDNDLIIWPEAAIPRLESLSQDYLQELDDLAAKKDTGLITGIVNYNFETRQVFNNLITLGKRHADDDAGHYQYLHDNRFAKHHLLPIGEFIPLEDWLRGIAPLFDLPMSSFTRGAFRQPNLVANSVHLTPAICFEIAFPRQVGANIDQHTDAIITVSNDAWFGRSHGPAQHLEIARVRAKEFGLPVLRATNNGITAFINEKGDVVARLPQFQAGSIEHTVEKVTGSTPYRRFGDTIIWLVMLCLTIECWRASRR